MINKKYFFISTLLNWHLKNREEYPWRKDPDPYHILLAEILLRKTDRKKVLSLYTTLINSYGTPENTASANIGELEKMLKPLGLSSQKAKQLKKASEIILTKFNSKVPENLEDLLDIPGVGKYTANAVLCFGYGQKTPLIDTNLIRLLKRYFNLRSEKSREREDKQFWEFIKDLLPDEKVKEFYYSVLDFTNQICKLNHPKCCICPLNEHCSYYNSIKGKY